MKRVKNVYLVIVFVFILAGCGQEEPTPEPTAVPTSTPSPASSEPEEVEEPEPATLPPTETPPPTDTPQPTDTPEPSPTPLSAESLIEVGDTQLLLSDWRGAEDAYRQAIEVAPDNALAHARLAYLLQFHPQSLVEAVEVAREAAEMAPDDTKVVTFLLLTLIKSGAYDEALPYAEQIEPLVFNDPFGLSVIAELYMAMGDFETADSHLQTANIISGFAFGLERVEIRRILTRHALLTGNRAEALQFSAQLIDSAPQFAPIYHIRSEVVGTGGFRDITQRSIVADGLILDSDYLPLMAQLARIDAWDGNFELALDSCEDIQRLASELPDGLLCQGEVLLQQEMYEQAGEAFNQALALNEADHRGFLGRGQVSFGLGDCETAESDLLAALEQQPYAAAVHQTLGSVYLCLGNTAEAETAFQNALALEPADPLANYEVGKFYLAQNLYEEATDAFYTAVLNATPGSTPPDYYRNLGQSLHSLDQCPTAASPELAQYLCAGLVLLNTGDNFQAADAFSLALELDENSVVGLEGQIMAYSREGLCDLALTYLVRLSDIQEPQPVVVETFDSNCTVLDPDISFEPEGELVSEDDAVRMIEAAVLEIEGVDDVFIIFDNTDPVGNELDGERILIVQYITDLERDSAELNRQLSEVVFAATEGFVLADSEPFFMIVQARVSLNEVPPGFVVLRFSALFWYNGDISTALYRQTWNSIDEILENLEAGE